MQMITGNTCLLALVYEPSQVEEKIILYLYLNQSNLAIEESQSVMF